MQMAAAFNFSGDEINLTEATVEIYRTSDAWHWRGAGEAQEHRRTGLLESNGVTPVRSLRKSSHSRKCLRKEARAV